VFGLLDGEEMLIKPAGFDQLHMRGGESHRLRQDNSKWKPLGIGEEGPQADEALDDEGK
jgi:lysine 2,3-aminomutase